MLSQHVEPFSCSVTPEGDHVVVAPRGELDMATVGALEQELKSVREAGHPAIVLDLRGLSFMDSSGLHLVMRWAADASRDGFKFELEPGPAPVQRIFEMAALNETLPWRSEP